MEIKSAEIKYFKKDGFTSRSAENLKHVKILPYLSIVQSVEGSYEITLGNDAAAETGEGGFFVAPSGVQQRIVHHQNPKSGQIICRWLFIDVEINKSGKLDALYTFPTVLDEATRKEMNRLFDRLFATEDVWENYSDCYQILKLLFKTAKPAPKKINPGIQDALAYMTEHYEEPITIKKLAEIAKMSESNFYAAFKRHLGSAPMTYLNHYRLSLAAARLTETEDTIGEISYAVGIKDPLYFSKSFKKTYGVTPRGYREMVKG